jgi:hypothetical protein
VYNVKTVKTGHSGAANLFQPQSREYYSVLIDLPLLTICTVKGWDLANTLERMRPPPKVAGVRGMLSVGKLTQFIILPCLNQVERYTLSLF